MLQAPEYSFVVVLVIVQKEIHFKCSASSDLIMKKYQINQNKDILQNNWPVLFKNVSALKDKGWGTVQD